jgi:BCD family chlorophyll transporter-like MFS transporter
MYLLFVVLVALGPMLRASRLAARAQAQNPGTPITPFGLAQLPN